MAVRSFTDAKSLRFKVKRMISLATHIKTKKVPLILVSRWRKVYKKRVSIGILTAKVAWYRPANFLILWNHPYLSETLLNTCRSYIGIYGPEEILNESINLLLGNEK